MNTCTCRLVYDRSKGFHVKTGKLCDFCKAKADALEAQRAAEKAVKADPNADVRAKAAVFCAMLKEIIPPAELRADFILNHLDGPAGNMPLDKLKAKMVKYAESKGLTP